MPDKYNFSKHLTQVLKPALSQLGFKKKGAKFISETEGLTFVFEISRSRWNGAPGPDELSLHIHVISAGINSTILLHRPTIIQFPSHYAPFFQDKLDWTEKSILMQSFSDEEKKEIHNYLDSISWKYHNEEELVTLFQELKNQIIEVGIPTLKEVKGLVNNGLNSFSLSDEMRKHSSRLYLRQLNPESRFPEQ